MTGIYILHRGVDGLADPTSPALLSNAAPGWALDIDRFGPGSSVSEPVATHHRPSCLIAGPCSSALDVAWHLSQRNTLLDWDSVLTLSQQAGRGQFGRDWHSPAGNLYAAWQLATPPARFEEMLPILLGSVISTTLVELGWHCRLKWPNDLIINDKKVGGILVENRSGVTLAGIGINLTSAPEADILREQHAAPAGCLGSLGDTHTPLALWLQLTSRGCRQLIELFEQKSEQRVLQQVTQSMAYLGEPVMVSDYRGGSFEAKIVGLSPTGGLKVQTEGGLKEIRSGSISLPMERFKHGETDL